MTPQQAKTYLNSFIDLEQSLGQLTNKEFKMERVHKILAALGNPHQNLRAVHIAGSKGKGSTSVMVAHILKEAGYKVGLYTSPHVRSYNERIRILRRDAIATSDEIFPDCVTDDQLAQVLTDTAPMIEEVRQDQIHGRLTFYEVYTALALYFFNQEQVDFVVLETGLGGRLDATNVVDSLVAVITPISLEHTHILGDTLDKIAYEKAAIIKRRQDVVIAPQQSDAMKVILKQCELFNIKPVDIKRDIIIRKVKQGLQNQLIHVTTGRGDYQNLEILLLGEHQCSNAAVAISVAELIKDKGFFISTHAIYQGLKSAFWPIRFEIIRSNPLVILDAAHNEDSMLRLTETVRSFFGNKKVHLVLGVSNDKKITEICRAVKEIAGRVYITKANHIRAYDFGHEESMLLFSGIHVINTDSVGEALRTVLSECSEKDIVLVTGSIFVASEARGLLLNKTPVTVQAG